jgi:ABC-2 type transport system ATP-binding protein
MTRLAPHLLDLYLHGVLETVPTTPTTRPQEKRNHEHVDPPAAPTSRRTSASAAISMREVVKSYGRVRALDGLDLEVARGEVHGFLGPNGAGKSTTIRILLGILRHDSGTVRLLGEDPWSKAVSLHRRLAYVPGDVELWPGLTGGEAIDLFAGCAEGSTERRRDELIERLRPRSAEEGTDLFEGQPAEGRAHLSSGLGCRTAAPRRADGRARPAHGSGVPGLHREAKEAGRTVLLSSHILAQVEALADRVSIIRSGRIVETGTLSELRHLSRTTITVGLEHDVPALSE